MEKWLIMVLWLNFIFSIDREKLVVGFISDTRVHYVSRDVNGHSFWFKLQPAGTKLKIHTHFFCDISVNDNVGTSIGLFVK